MSKLSSEPLELIYFLLKINLPYLCRSQRLGAPTDWRVECRELLELIWQCDDSNPFREPVDIIEHPDYSQIVDTPMDLRTIQEDLRGGNYQTPLDFAKDMRLIFQNSRNYNTNKRSRVSLVENVSFFRFCG